MLAREVMVRLASFSSTAVMSASPCTGSRRTQQLNKPLGEPDSRDDFTSGHSLIDTHNGQSQTSGFRNPQGLRHNLYTHTTTYIPRCRGQLCSNVQGEGLLFHVQTSVIHYLKPNNHRSSWCEIGCFQAQVTG